MARTYTAQSNNVAVSAVQDLISIETTAAMVMEVDELAFGQDSDNTVGNLQCSFQRFSGVYSIGSGGSSVVPVPHLFGDAAAICTARANDTAQTTGGSSVILDSDAINVVNGYDKLPAPEDRWSFTISQAFVWSLDTAPASAETVSVKATFRETV